MDDSKVPWHLRHVPGVVCFAYDVRLFQAVYMSRQWHRQWLVLRIPGTSTRQVPKAIENNVLKRH